MIRLRPATEADAPRAAELVMAVDIAEVGEPDYSLQDLREEWAEPGFDLAQDAVVAEADGEPIGYAHFRPGDLLAVVDPAREGEGAGSALLGWAERRARERGQSVLRQGIGDRARRARRLLETNGWGVVRSYFRLERALGDEGEPAFRGLQAGDELFPIYEAAFASRPDFTRRSAAAWTREHLHAHDLDPETSRVEPDKGFTLVRRWDDGVAYIVLLAVRPDHAGRGLGGALLTATFAAASRHGYRQAALNVASDNPAALRLYERVGMTRRWRIDDYHKSLPD